MPLLLCLSLFISTLPQTLFKPPSRSLPPPTNHPFSHSLPPSNKTYIILFRIPRFPEELNQASLADEKNSPDFVPFTG
ncbi:hypothetical protein Pmani_037611 [Petrolisthes manimaculis]|uniref:Uncharacterized protein n=1 Tax=Petrolisthes manimaculis TaxID=1843537 RepID=A0AAE1TKZ4_9EUCA|nr:hypothetical protein Pmani_037611 [Petrolisthes manimaculis]